MIKYADLHMHSCLSDGDKTPEELVHIAEKKDISVISLTDHDCVDGVQRTINEACKYGINVISGVELSCYDKKDTHVLGYRIDCKNSVLKNALFDLQQSRMNRMIHIVNGLINDGFELTMEDVKKHCSGQVMGRPHVAAALIEKGYGKNIRDVFNKYIGTGCKYYVSYKKLDVREGIDLIHNAGGLAVLAHPKLLRYNSSEFSELLKKYKNWGLDGIEVYYPCHYDENVRLFSKLAQELKLLMTCGGDYHNDFDKTKNHMGFETGLPGIKDSINVLAGSCVLE